MAREKIPPDDERLLLAAALRDEWLRHGIDTRPAVRTEAEAAVTGLYELVGAPPPRFLWFPSPVAAVPVVREHDRRGFNPLHIGGLPAPARGTDWPFLVRFASLSADLRTRLEPPRPRAAWPFDPGRRWTDPRTVDPAQGVAEGLSSDTVIGAMVRDSLGASLRDAVQAPIRAALTAAVGDPPALAWSGQHDAWWIAHHDVRARIGLVRHEAQDTRQLGLWAALARSAGWWWPRDGLCVMVERPVALHTEPSPGGRHGELRLHHENGPAVRFADGMTVHVVHGTPVPSWVVTDPTVERIHAEPNIEVRRTAIERIGWDTYIDEAGLRPVATAADPGNAGSELCLYEAPARLWGASARVLLVVNGSVEPDGRRRRYGLRVPADIDDPVAAAGWCYGLTGDQYAGLVRRT